MLLAVAPSARAAQCQTAADCGKGFTCQLVTAPPPVDAKPACAPGSVCPADPGPATPGGQAATTGYCTEAPCTTDADCGPTMVCHTDMIMSCSGGGSACPPNAECLVPDMKPVCTTTSASTCRYKWELSCKVDADCGDGFTCAFATITGCSGGGVAGSGTASSGTVSPGMTGTGGAASGAPAPAVDGGVAPAPGPTPVQPPDTCVTTTSTTGACTPKATTCAVDGDCPAAWTCVDLPPVRGEPTPATSADGGAGSGAGAPAPTGNASSIAPGEPDPAGTGTPAPTKACQSPLGTLGGVALDASGAPKEAGSSGTGGAAGGNTTGANGGTPPATPGPDTKGGAQRAS
ncbi:MAG TPA: hypothetical protein VHL80_12220, partial [Polyangia bacterium]|nr:hypothetical protein [Polyangia bacterium]